MAWLHWKELQGSPFHSRPSDFSFLFCQLIKKRFFFFVFFKLSSAHLHAGRTDWVKPLNESRLFGLAYYSEWCFPCLATFKRSGKNKKPFRLPQSESKRKMENLHILFLCLCLCALPVFALIVLVPLFPADYSAVSLVCVSKRSPREKKKNTLVFISKSVKCYFRIPSVTRSGRLK